jgi:hypothetical protein
MTMRRIKFLIAPTLPRNHFLTGVTMRRIEPQTFRIAPGMIGTLRITPERSKEKRQNRFDVFFHC